jgi:hypothetical protein
MKTESKFNIGDLVSRRYDTITEDMKQVLEIMEISTLTCYAGTQIFYNCKQLSAIKQEGKYNYEKKQTPFNWIIGHGIGKEDNSTGIRRYREDELVECSFELREFFIHPPKGIIEII